MLIAVAGVLLGSFRLRDAQGIPRLEEFERQSGIQYYRVELVAGGNVAATLHQFVLSVDCLGGPFGGVANHILEDDHVARLTDGIIRFRGNDQSESLQVSGYAQFAAMVVAD